ncbi:unnamed protein product [Ceutorhynchus assimilis]|uniref:Mpv17-like protein n=1 Tax=Ceutorhynchus assimilis TaxID=467358 RepID=A0A9N9MDV4_9CUCU|nr:unnamed protein product [Ceutorhynchus assimilis]
MSKFLAVFRQFLEKRPILGNCVVYGTLCVAAETSQQLLNYKILEKPPKPLDTGTIARYVVYGTSIGGPLIANWYTFLDKKFPGTAMKTIGKKMLADQFFFSPQLLVVFYVSMSIMEWKQDLFEECRNKFFQTYLANCLFWIPCQTINFTFVPNVYRVTYIGICSFAWINILCYIKRQSANKIN